jgi:hypothetical protein
MFEQIKNEDYFDKHQIKKLGPTTWWCHVPGQGGIQSYYVSIQPGAIIMWGDVGEAIYLIYGGNPIVWGKRNFRFPDHYSYYPFTKLSPQLRDEQFRTEDATVYLKNAIKEAGTIAEERQAKKMLEAWKERSGNEPHEDEGAWWSMWDEFGTPDAPDMRGLSARTYWCFFCLCWFFSHVSADDERFKEAYTAWPRK